MLDKRIVHFLRHAVMCLLLVLAASGCATWHATDLTPAQVFAAERPSSIRVTTTDGVRRILVRTRLLGDVLAGWDDDCVNSYGRDSSRCEEMGIAVFEISLLELRERGYGATIFPAVAGLTLVWLLVNR